MHQITTPHAISSQFLAKKDGEIAALRSALAAKSSTVDTNARRTTMDPPATEADDLEKVVASMEAASLASSSGEESAYSSDGSDDEEDVPIEEIQGMVHVASVSVEASWSGETDGSEEEAPEKEDRENEAPARLGGTRKVLGTNAAVRYGGGRRWRRDFERG